MGARDRGPQGVDLALGGQQVLLGRLVLEHLAIAQIDQLQQVGDPPRAAPEHQGVEFHLEQRLGLEDLTRRATGLVVDHPDGTRSVDVDPVDVPAEQQPRVEDVLDVQLALCGLQPGGILELEVRGEQRSALRQPLDQIDRFLVMEHRRQPRLLCQHPFPLRPEQIERGLRRPVGRG